MPGREAQAGWGWAAMQAEWPGDTRRTEKPGQSLIHLGAPARGLVSNLASTVHIWPCLYFDFAVSVGPTVDHKLIQQKLQVVEQPLSRTRSPDSHVGGWHSSMSVCERCWASVPSVHPWEPSTVQTCDG